MNGTGFCLVDEFCRAGSLQNHFFRRCQREFRDTVLPALALIDANGGPDAVVAALAERDQLRAELDAERAKKAPRAKPALEPAV
jgi:hypothetical protein